MLGVGNLDAPTAIKKIRKNFDNYRDRQKRPTMQGKRFSEDKPISPLYFLTVYICQSISIEGSIYNYLLKKELL